MSGWIKHDGRGMPVDGDTKVEVRQAFGFVHEPDLAKNWLERDGSRSNWNHVNSVFNHPCDIIEYRVVVK